MKPMNEQLRNYFKEKGISQVEIAEKLGVTKNTVNRYFLGYSKFGKAQAEKWHAIFGISKAFLLTGEGLITDEDATQYEENISNLTGTIHILTDTIREKDRTIENLKARIAELENLIKLTN